MDDHSNPGFAIQQLLKNLVSKLRTPGDSSPQDGTGYVLTLTLTQERYSQWMKLVQLSGVTNEQLINLLMDFVHQNATSGWGTLQQSQQGPSHQSNDPPGPKGDLDDELNCVYCGKSYGSRSKTREHVRRRHKCGVCRMVNQGEAISPDEQCCACQHVCGQCGKSFANYYCYSRHLERTKCSTRTKTCEHCGKTYPAARLYKHVADVHKIKPHTCLHCGKGFATPRTLQKHIKTHGKNANCITCEQCGSMFPTQELFRFHHFTQHANHFTAAGHSSQHNPAIQYNPVLPNGFS